MEPARARPVDAVERIRRERLIGDAIPGAELLDPLTPRLAEATAQLRIGEQLLKPVAERQSPLRNSSPALIVFAERGIASPNYEPRRG